MLWKGFLSAFCLATQTFAATQPADNDDRPVVELGYARYKATYNVRLFSEIWLTHKPSQIHVGLLWRDSGYRRFLRFQEHQICESSRRSTSIQTTSSCVHGRSNHQRWVCWLRMPPSLSRVVSQIASQCNWDHHGSTPRSAVEGPYNVRRLSVFERPCAEKHLSPHFKVRTG